MKTLITVLFIIPMFCFAQEYPHMKLINGQKIILITFAQMQQINELHQRAHFFEGIAEMRAKDIDSLHVEIKGLRTALNSLKNERQFHENVQIASDKINSGLQKEVKYYKRKLRRIKIRDWTIIAGLGLGAGTAVYFIVK